jgi:hypothetical protein
LTFKAKKAKLPHMKLISLLFLTLTLLNPLSFAQSPEMQIYEVVKVHESDDIDEFMIFTLNDGCRYFRTWWEGPIYYLTPGQEVGLIPMNEEEAAVHPDPFFGYAIPYWIFLQPDAINFGAGICFKMD